MLRYFFDVDEGDLGNDRDEAGMRLICDEAARREAYSIISKYAANPINLFASGTIVVTVRDSSSSVVTKLRMVMQEEICPEEVATQPASPFIPATSNIRPK